MSFIGFYKKNLAFARLAILTNLQNRLSFIADAILNPCISSSIEMFLWFSIFTGSQLEKINGFTQNSYMSYALWASFFARATSNWMYEFRMSEEIEKGTLNSILVRPVSFYEYYLSQLFGYKFITMVIPFIIPFFVCSLFNLPFHLSRFPLTLLLVVYYLLLIHTLSFIVSTLGFYIHRTNSITTAKNLTLWTLTGELFPLDLLPESLKTIFFLLPFPCGVYIPVGYLTGRLDTSFVWRGFASITIFMIGLSLFVFWFWKRSLKKYSGTGA